MLFESIIIVIGVLAIAFLFAPLGLGGGILYVPLFHYVGGWELDQKLIIVSLLLSAVTSYGSGIEHRKKGYVDDVLIRRALYGAIPGAMIGVLFVMMTGTDFKSIFKILSVVVVGFVIFKMVRKVFYQQSNQMVGRKAQLGKMTLLSGFGGFLSSVMAIGAGMIYVPAMKFFGNLEARKSIGSSLNIMMVVIPFAVVAHFLILDSNQMEKLVDESVLLLVLVLTNFIGSKFGAIIGFNMFSEDFLIKLFIGVLSITWLNYLIDILF